MRRGLRLAASPPLRFTLEWGGGRVLSPSALDGAFHSQWEVGKGQWRSTPDPSAR